MSLAAGIPAPTPLDPAVTPRAQPRPIHWSPLLRIGFRFCFCYYALWILLNGNATIWDVLPRFGDTLGEWAWKPLARLAVVLAHHLFRLPGDWGPRASGDTALDWILTGIFVALACAGTLLWSLLDRRPAYPTLLAWLRFGLRLALGVAMLEYGFAKVFPLQMPTPSLAVLSEPVGQMAPMTLLWTMIGSSPAYEILCGLAEVAGGLLILVRRTALLGALLIAFVATNIVLYNFCFDVPVKLFALHLLLAAIFVTLPDLRALVSFFWNHVPAAPAGVWVPPAERIAFRRATVAIEIAFLVLVAAQQVWYGSQEVLSTARVRNVHTPMQGAWRVQAAATAPASTSLPGVALIYVDHATASSEFQVNARSPAGDLVWGSLDTKAQTLNLSSRLFGKQHFHYAMLGADQVTLTSVPPAAGKGPLQPGPPPATLRLQRAPLPAKWPLLTRGFHLVNEFPYQR